MNWVCHRCQKEFGDRKGVRKHGQSRNRIYTTRNWIKIAKQIYKRDNWECQICFKHGRLLNAHHKDINPLNNNFNNLITLCPSCHNKVHRGELMC